MKAHTCGPDCLPNCKHKQAGLGGIGRRKSKPSVRGRDKREARYAADHPWCEWVMNVPIARTRWGEDLTYPLRCGAPVAHIHHLEGRGLGGATRQTSPLMALCAEHHLVIHGQKVA